MNIYLIRHGQTEYNTLEIFQGKADSPLTDLGISQGKICGQQLKNVNFVAAYSSPQKRAFDTCLNILSGRDIPITQINDLREMEFGLWEGQKESIVKQQYTDEYKVFKEDPLNYTASLSQGEKFDDVEQRIASALSNIINKHNNEENILVVSHGSIIRLLLNYFAGNHWKDHKRDIPTIENAKINIVKVTKENNVDIPNIKTEIIAINQ